jgi:uncharacterized surface protein with fasciclin (FAS1) repeats
MKRSTLVRRTLVATAGLALVLGTSACGGSDDEATTAPAATMASPTDEMADDSMTDDSMTDDSMTDDSMTDEMASGPVGPGCADYAAAVPSGDGSVDGMAADPVAVAASNNPLLTTLTAAVSGQLNPDVNLVDTLNGGEFTVFAPVDEAFAAVPDKTVTTLKTDDELLTEILTYHVVPGRIAPDDIVGEHETVQGETLSVTGTPDMLKVNDADVICGGVSTANATVYLIDGVLTPPAK